MLALVAAAVGCVAVLLLTVFAHGTTSGVTEDVRGFSTLLGRLLIFPVQVLQLVVILLAPAAVLVELGFRRLGRQVVESIIAVAAAFVLGALLTEAIHLWGSQALIADLSVGFGADQTLSLPLYAASLGALLTVAGPRTRRRTVAWSWNLLFFTLVVLVITGLVSLPGSLLAVLFGRVVGFAVRYVSGVRSERAYGPDLVAAVRRAGFTPSTIVRVRDLSSDAARAEAATDDVTRLDRDGVVIDRIQLGPVLRDGVPVTITEDATIVPGLLPEARRDDPADTASSDPSAIALSRAGDKRVYSMFTPYGKRRDVVVLDGDRQVVGFLTRFWRALRLRGLGNRAAISLRAVAERDALLSYAATSAGVRTPRLLGIGEATDSMVLVQEHAPGVSLRDLDPDHVTDAVLAEAWRQIRTAHSAGLAHRALTSDILLIDRTDDARPKVWLTGWEQGDVASTEFARRMDITQMIALLALRVGAARAVASAVDVLPDDEIAAIGPLLQPIALPRTTREEIRRDKGLLADLRAALVTELPEAVVEPAKIERFGARTIIMLTLGIVAAFVILGTIKLDEITAALAQANPWWALAAFGLGLFTWIGSAMSFVAFSPVKLPWSRTIYTQAAGSFVALAAPAGVGAAALNLQMLTRRKVKTPLAVATVTVVQVSQFVVTILLLLLLSVLTGEGGLVQLPSTTVLFVIAAVLVAVLATMLIPKVRVWVLAKVRPTAQQIWPRLSEILGQPWRLVLGVAGNVILTLSYVLAFDASLAAFGQDLTLIDAALIYLVGNAAGAAVPVPGGIGAIEIALTTGLTAAGIPLGIATAVTAVFRVATYWGRIPFGWVAMRYLQRTGDL
ncbi:membrane protein [Paraoerskovia sediminicola]|uniref:Membrane protein n=1 Tax=Paraoerskovia sediminicola TaxID=1138587 RepID=A0ABM8G144_9CELL|nr:lysylphosphatidylglycerol synthase domain-containing protein [Paraoerskovia sediminicola]BDZ41700.1 membrane protein [Paraoerskovia sediminicola]